MSLPPSYWLSGRKLLETIFFAEALTRVAARCTPVEGVETVPAADARNRILATDLVAPMAVPSADNSGVDGYAFRHADLLEHDEFSVVGAAAAGRPFAGALKAGEAVRIFTGALPPGGADAIAMQEEVKPVGARIWIPRTVPRDANIRRAGEDIAAGVTVFGKGRRLAAAELGMLASLGFAELPVRRKLRIAVLSTGEELVEPGENLAAGQIYDSNRATLHALLGPLEAEVTDLGIVPDNRVMLTAALAEAAGGCDAILSSAGVSVGDEDHVGAAIATLGSLDFASVALKPGRPVTLGRIGETPIFALPGNPVAMLVCFLMLVRPGLLRLAGATDTEPWRIPVRAGFTLRKRPDRREFARATLNRAGEDIVARPFPRGGSGILSSIAESDGLLELAEDVTDIAPGMALPFLPFVQFGL
jgi:molybdopterin molybdotransferase